MLTDVLGYGGVKSQIKQLINKGVMEEFKIQMSEEEALNVVLEKIKKNVKKVPGMQLEDMKRYARNLSDKEALKHAYLNKEFDAIKEMVNLISL